MARVARTDRPSDEAASLRFVGACVLISLVLHGAGLLWFTTMRSAGAGDATRHAVDQQEADTPEEFDRSRLGIESSQRTTINWLGFADPTPHRAVESQTDQAALTRALPGAPDAPSTVNPGEADGTPPAASGAPPVAIETPSAESAAAASEAAAPPSETQQDSAADAQPMSGPPEKTAAETLPAGEAQNPIAAAETPASTEAPAREPTQDPAVEPTKDATEAPPTSTPDEVTPEAQAKETADAKPTDERTTENETTDAAPAESASPSEAAPARPEGKIETPGADAVPGILSDRESSPTVRTVDLSIKDWGKPAAGQGIKVNPVRPRFPDTLAVFGRILDATVLIDFGGDGRVRDVRFETVTIKQRKITRSTGSPEADRVLINSVYNWTASGDEISALAKRGADARITIRMEMQIRP